MSDKCGKCGSSKGFFNSMGSIECSEAECTEWLCRKCKDSGVFKDCPDCGYVFCNKHLTASNHGCEPEETDEEDTEEEAQKSEEEFEEEEGDEESEDESDDAPEEIDLKQAEEEEWLIFSEDRRWVAFDASNTDDWQSTFNYLDKIISEGYVLYCTQGDYYVYKKGGA